MPDQMAQTPGLPSAGLHNQPGYQHMRHAPSASPPIPNGVPFHHRQHTPQPPMASRPASVNGVRRQSTNIPSQLHHTSQAPSDQNGYNYVPSPPVYNAHPPRGIGAPGHDQQSGQHPQYRFNPQQPPPQNHQVQQAYMQEQRRQSMPPAFPQQGRPQQQHSTPSPPQPEREPRRQESEPQALKQVSAKSRSIFTPIDDSRSLLAQHWGIGTTNSEPRREIKIEKDSRSQSIEMANVQKNDGSMATPPPPPKPRGHPPRNQSISTVSSGDFQPPSRADSGQTGAKRPRLKVQIPSEQSDDGSATAHSSPRESGETTGGTPAKASTDASHSSSGVVLPPPSPSASAILSAGATGPPNPFARPAPPMTSVNQPMHSNSMDKSEYTPISALPSRFVDNGLLPSPSSFYPEWGFGRSTESNMLPSPLNFGQTPVMGTGPSFLREEEGEKKRKSPDGDGQEASNPKRVKA